MSKDEKIKLLRPDFISSLNDDQLNAVTTTEGPLLVLSGAGTGKTKVLTSRLAHLIFSKKAKINQILAVTFTNKAAFEMKMRVEKLIKSPVEGMYIGTFHSIGAKILRKHAELVNLKRDFTILDVEDQIRLIKQVISYLNLDKKKFIAKNYQYYIDSLKNSGLYYDQILNHDFENFTNGYLSKIYEIYQKRLITFNAVDFGDLILQPVRILKLNPNILNQFQEKFKYILVDEYQDTNTSQYFFLRLLAKKFGNICCVGDEDQSIYGWRGAQLKNILNFEKDFEKSKIIRLEQNYRSTGNILMAASGIISENTERIGKKLWTSDNDGEKVEIFNVENDETEAFKISENIKNLIIQNISLKEVAILTRASFQFKEIEDRFVKDGIKYKVVGGLKFYERKEIKDAISFFRIMINRNDDLALERIINIPKRGIGSKYLSKINLYIRQKNISLFDGICYFTENHILPRKVTESLQFFLNILQVHFDRMRKEKHSDVAGSLLDDVGYTSMLQEDKTPEAEGRLENLKKLIIDIDKRASLFEFLEEVSLIIDNTENFNEVEKVSLMTLHSAKGLEFEYVFLPGWEEGIFPNQRSIDEQGNKGLEEERRLAYVGITRARKSLKIFYANTRKQYNHILYSTIPSRFLEELPNKNCQVIISKDKIFEEKSYNKLKVIENSDFKVGDKVIHKDFGYGIVLGVNYKTLQINFEDQNQILKLFSDFVKKI